MAMTGKSRNCLVLAVLGGTVMLASSNCALAQVGFFPNQTNPLYRPAVSPYLNLARGGNPAINYYGIVKPQVDFGRQIQMLQLQQQSLMPTWGLTLEDDLTQPTTSITGHPSMFFNYGHYFGQSNTGGQFGQ